MASHHDPELLPFSAFRPDPCGRMRLYKKDSDAPDYKPMADASKETAQIMADLGHEQLDFARQQYAENAPILQELAQSQIDISKQTAAQGKDYYDYMVSQQRPVEEALNADAMAAGSADAQERAAGQAAADVRQGTTQQMNQLARQGLRYGFSPEKLAAMSTAAASSQGLSIASAMNQAREKEKSLGYAKKLDVAGLYRGLAGASQGAYGVALAAGNSAGQNQMAPGQAAMAGMGQGANTIASGRSMYQQGLGTILNSQTQMAMNDGGGGLGDVGAILGAGVKVAGMMGFSDRDLKENIARVGETALGIGIYEFNYINDPVRYRGVMADEVEQRMPDAVEIDEQTGYKKVDYAKVGVEMEEV